MASYYGLSRPLRSFAQPFTVTGRLLALAGAFCLLGVIAPSLAGLLSHIAVLNVIAFVLGLFYRPRLIVSTKPQPVAIKGHPFAAVVSIKNTGRLPAYDLVCTLVWTPWMNGPAGEKTFSAIAPGETVTATFKLISNQRGLFELPAVRVASLFPASLFRFFNTYAIRRPLVVAPSFAPIDPQFIDSTGRSVSDEQLISMSGQSSYEYVGSCEFRPGMSVRRWDFASWARLGKPAIREFSEWSESPAILIVDGRRHIDDVNQLEFEAALSRAAAMIDFLLEGQRDVAMIIVGNALTRHDVVEPTADYDEHMTMLAGVRPSTIVPDWQEIADVVVNASTRDATCYWISQSENESSDSEISSLAELLPDLRIHVVGSSVDASNSPENPPVSVETGP